MGEGMMLHRISGRVPKISYTGEYTSIYDGNGDWRIKFLTSGTLVFLSSIPLGIDVFLVGGGGGGGSHYQHPSSSSAGGGGGYAATYKNISVIKGTSYPIVVGAAGENNKYGSQESGRHTGSDGGASSAFGYTANGGAGGYAGYHFDGGTGTGEYAYGHGGDGGSGGGTAASGPYNGGTDGSDGPPDSGHWNRGSGQGTTTREFGEAGGDLYAGGGGANNEHKDNSGNGGCPSILPSSGIVIIRKHKE